MQDIIMDIKDITGAYIHPNTDEQWNELAMILDNAGYDDYIDYDTKSKDDVLAIYTVPGQVFNFAYTDFVLVMQNLDITDVENPKYWLKCDNIDQFLGYAQEMANIVNHENKTQHAHKK